MIKFLKDPKVAHSFHGTCDVDASEVDGLEAWLSLRATCMWSTSLHIACHMYASARNVTTQPTTSPSVI